MRCFKPCAYVDINATQKPSNGCLFPSKSAILAPHATPTERSRGARSRSLNTLAKPVTWPFLNPRCEAELNHPPFSSQIVGKSMAYV